MVLAYTQLLSLTFFAICAGTYQLYFGRLKVRLALSSSCCKNHVLTPALLVAPCFWSPDPSSRSWRHDLHQG